MFYLYLGSPKILFTSSETFSALKTGRGKLNISSMSLLLGYLNFGKRERAAPASKRH
jgi:hypothetical protein